MSNINKVNESNKSEVLFEIKHYLSSHCDDNTIVLNDNCDIKFIEDIVSVVQSANLSDYIPIAPDDESQLHIRVLINGVFAISSNTTVSMQRYSSGVLAVLNNLISTEGPDEYIDIFSRRIMELGLEILAAANGGEEYIFKTKAHMVAHRIGLLHKFSCTGEARLTINESDTILEVNYTDKLWLHLTMFTSRMSVLDIRVANGIVHKAYIATGCLNNATNLSDVFTKALRAIGHEDLSYLLVEGSAQASKTIGDHITVKRTPTHLNAILEYLKRVMVDVDGVENMIVDNDIVISLPFGNDTFVIRANFIHSTVVISVGDYKVAHLYVGDIIVHDLFVSAIALLAPLLELYSTSADELFTKEDVMQLNNTLVDMQQYLVNNFEM